MSTKKTKVNERVTSLPSVIAERIREEIGRGTLSPGLHLGQAELATQFGASRVPIREALKLLAADGIVVHDPNRGFFIASLSSNEARQLYRMRHLLEAEILASVEWPDRRRLADLEEQLERMEGLLAGGERADWVHAHRRFHQMVFDLSPHRVIVEEVRRLLRLTDRYRSLLPVNAPRGERRADQERHLLKALANKDRDRLLEHFEQDRSEIEAGILRALLDRGL
ncbi:MAG TPA: GntR family transcriptional regulator [Steroidobacteraceae bacterium]|nr:GntR family transcriptional regulator [Steroidobacteraceae bacterium]